MKFSNIIKEKTGFLVVENNDGFEVTFSTLGASIYLIKYKGVPMTLTPNVKDWIKPTLYHGKTIGRVGNRIRGNKVVCEGKEYIVENNEGPNTLHGGIHGISTQTFTQKVNCTQDYTEIIYSYTSPEGESGFPATLNLNIIYKVYEKGARIDLDLFANTDKESLCSLTNHSYFNVGEKDESQLKLTIKGTRFIIPNKDDLLGEGIGKVPSYLNFSKGRVITDDIELPVLKDSKTRGYDHHFFFDKPDTTVPQVILEGNKYMLEIYTDYSGAQLYSDNVADGIKYVGTSVKMYRGCALEPQESHLKLHYLKPDDTYHHFIKYIFKEI